ncbi:geranylgeranyl pyrophosphate synthase [Clostridia bacterium]|nr:geranylgeranyl pyrophosphate synthase [Clostridia bacterium]
MIEEALCHVSALITQTLQAAPLAVRDMTTSLSQTTGKAVRARLLLICSCDNAGAIPDVAVRAAAAAELFHLATLVHDDVIDDAALRRGKPALHRAFGARQAVICGDWLLCAAMTLLSKDANSAGDVSRLVPTFTGAVSAVCLGELEQHRRNRDLDLGVIGYLRVISGKTAALFHVSAYAGAVAGGATEREVRKLARFGRYLGLVFQIADDCKDYESDVAASGKPVAKDITEGVITLPLILAMAKNPELRAAAAAAMDSDKLGGELSAMVRGAGGTKAARELSDRYARKARQSLIDIVPHKCAALEEILEKTRKR